MGSEQRLDTVVYQGTQVFEAIVANEAPYFAMGKGSHRLNPPTYFERAGWRLASVDQFTAPKKASRLCRPSPLKIGPSID